MPYLAAWAASVALGFGAALRQEWGFALVAAWVVVLATSVALLARRGTRRRR